MRGSRSHQPSRLSDNAADYVGLFIPRVHRLIQLGYSRLNPARYVNAQETAITGDLADAVEGVLDYPTAGWMRFYCVHDDPPENQPKRRRQRRGRNRQRVDIRLDSSEFSPRARLRFECKRLGKGHTAAEYLGRRAWGVS